MVLSILSITMAALVLLSTLSFTIGKHYCMGKVVDVSFTGKTNGCATTIEDEDSGNSQETNIENDCCADIIEIIKSNNSELNLTKAFSLDVVKFSTIFFATYINLFEELPKDVIPFKDYAPPLITVDLTVLHDTFLI